MDAPPPVQLLGVKGYDDGCSSCMTWGGLVEVEVCENEGKYSLTATQSVATTSETTIPHLVQGCATPNERRLLVLDWSFSAYKPF